MSDSEKFLVEIARRRAVADDIIALDLVLPDGGDLPEFDAGAHIDIRIDTEFVRQYSLYNSPDERHRYQIAVLNDPNSRGGSRRLHELFLEGRRVHIKPPKNFFPLDETGEAKTLFAGGIGVTPMIAMAHALHAKGEDFQFIYCARSRSKAAFVEELAAAPFASKISFFFDDETDQGKFDAAKTIRALGLERHLYICGPSGFIDYIRNTAKELQVADKRVHIEHFDNEVEQGGDEITVIAERSGVTVTVKPDETIADALLAVGVDLQVSCEQGVCGTCICDVLEGIPDHRDVFLDDDEKAENTQIAPCCSRAKTPTLKLDI